MYQDQEGVLWLGTTDGLCRYDGYGLHVFRSSPMYPTLLPHNDIREITETRDGKILIGTQKGMCAWDKRANRFISFTDSLLTNYEIRSIVTDDEGYIWVGSYKIWCGLVGFVEVKSYDSSLPVTSVNMVYKDEAGTVWAGFWQSGLYRYNRTTDRFERMPRLGLYDNPFRMLQDKQGRYWLSTWGRRTVQDGGGRQECHSLCQRVSVGRERRRGSEFEVCFLFVRRQPLGIFVDARLLWFDHRPD